MAEKQYTGMPCPECGGPTYVWRTYPKLESANETAQTLRHRICDNIECCNAFVTSEKEMRKDRIKDAKRLILAQRRKRKSREKTEETGMADMFEGSE